MRKHPQISCACYACKRDVLLRVRQDVWEQQVGLVPITTPLHAAAESGDLEAVERLVEAGHSLQVGLRVLGAGRGAAAPAC